MPNDALSANEDLLLHRVNEQIIKCKLCPRLTKYIQEVGKTKTKKHMDQAYWAKPVPTFGDPKAKLLVIGLAPAAKVEIEQGGYLREIALVIGLQELCLKQDLQINLQAYQRMMD